MGLVKKKKATRIKRVSMLEDSGIATSSVFVGLEGCRG